MSLKELFKGIDIAGSGSKHKRSGWVNVSCPYCDKGHNHHHLGFNIRNQYFTCYSCGKKPLLKTFDLLLGLRGTELLTLLKSAKKGNTQTGYTGYEEYNKPKKPFKLVPNLYPIKGLPQHKLYLKKRGFNWKKLVLEYGIMGTTMGSFLDNVDLSWRLFIPIFDNNKIVTWQTRQIGKTKLPYIACSKEREIVNIKNLLYPEEISHTVFLVEGLFDAWKVRAAGFPAVCSFGVGVSPAQIKALSKKRVIIFYDGDTVGDNESEVVKDRLEFVSNNIVQIAKCPKGKDPGSLDIKQIDNILRKYI